MSQQSGLAISFTLLEALHSLHGNPNLITLAQTGRYLIRKSVTTFILDIYGEGVTQRGTHTAVWVQSPSHYLVCHLRRPIASCHRGKSGL